MKINESDQNTVSVMASIRKSKGIKQYQLARKIKITPTYLSLVEKGREKPSLRLYLLIAKKLNIPFEKYMLLLVRNNFPKDKKVNQLFVEIEPIIKSLLNILVLE